ncbi:unnamed protein product [Euphydryas editha]|uniref:Snurportin-1 n=1 Tax=Euphydryas editha TaxID=104508 RepID=A0AAU9UXM6_EUPED|nr:unnamed protein product [Euphydryas editha]
MEDDFEKLEKALVKIEPSEAEEETSNNYETLYKNWGKIEYQEERRKKLLKIQKSNRSNKIDRFRGILNFNSVEDKEIFMDKKVSYTPNIYVAGFHKTCKTYSNILMLSEWMIEKPTDFSENWYVVPCPKGMRLLAVADFGTTKFYTKLGKFKFECLTGLPGGNPYNYNNGKNCCILDCIYNENTNTVYLLDIISWNKRLITDGETEFRQYWMEIQLENFPETKTINEKNKILIKILPMIPCTNHFLSHLLSTYPQFENNSPPLDGLMFYHKNACYISGETPLVGWLYPYMVPEVLGKDIDVHPKYMDQMPDGYVNQADFIQNLKKNYKN